MIPASEHGVIPKTSANTAEFRVTVSESFDGAGVTREEWDQLVLDVDGDLYITYDWCRIWWRHYGQDRQLRLYAFREGSRLVGLAPMFFERIWLGPISLKLAKRVGADFALTIFGLPFVVDYAELVYSEVITRLIVSENCDAVWFGFMPGNDRTLNNLRGACRSLQEFVTVARDAPAGPHMLFHLPDSFEAYVASLSGSRRHDYRRRLKYLNKNFKVESDVVRDPLEAQEAFAVFKSLHFDQWRAEGKPGHFGDWPRSELFNNDLVNELSRLGRFRMARLFADQKIIATHYAFVFGDSCYDRLTSRVMVKEWDRFGLGILGQMRLNELMISEGVHRIEAGVGHYDYKANLGAEELQCCSVLVATKRRGVALRVRVFLKLSDILDLVYYRIWRKRIAPSLPFKRSLWRTWIRCRV